MSVEVMEEVNLDQDFLMRFSCMGTQDKDVLISELHRILDSQLSREGCAFFLDMTNWNLQAAVGAFYDHYSSEGGVLPEMTLVDRKSTGGDVGTALTLPGNTIFTETWTLRNTGTMPWPLGIHLSRKAGEELCSTSKLHLPTLPPGAETSVTLEFHSPSSPGVYQCQWRTSTGGGALFGDPVWVIVHVQDAAVCGLAQQLSSITTQEGSDIMEMEGNRTAISRQQQNVALNPFGSPTLYQSHTFGSASMITTQQSVPTGTCLERLLQTQSHSQSAHHIGLNTATTTQSHFNSITADADSTSHSNPLSSPVANPIQAPESDSISLQPELLQNSASMEDSNETGMS